MHKLSMLVLAASLASVSFGQSSYQALVKDSKTRIKEVDADQLKQMQSSSEKFMLIDVREDSEWAAGHAAGATHLGKGVIERDIENTVPEKGAKLVLYCGGGFRSA